MGYNLTVGCHDCRVQCFALRGEEARVIRAFAIRHTGHHKCVSIDNGFTDEPWAEKNADSTDGYVLVPSDDLL